MLEGVRHGLVGGVGRSGTVHHLGQHAVEFIRAAGHQGKGTRASFHAGPQTGKGSAIIAHAVIQHLQHIAQALAVSTQLGKALAGLLL